MKELKNEKEINEVTKELLKGNAKIENDDKGLGCVISNSMQTPPKTSANIDKFEVFWIMI